MDLLTNPFLILGATMHDNRRRIMAFAEEKSLVLTAVGAVDAHFCYVLWFPRQQPMQATTVQKIPFCFSLYLS